MYNRHVVVVEDESLLRDLIAKTLETSGFQVTTAANAADAARVFKATDPDAVVLDVELGPGPNGFDFAESLQKTSVWYYALLTTQAMTPLKLIHRLKFRPWSIR